MYLPGEKMASQRMGKGDASALPETCGLGPPQASPHVSAVFGKQRAPPRVHAAFRKGAIRLR